MASPDETHWTSSLLRHISLPLPLSFQVSCAPPTRPSDPETSLKSLLTQTFTTLTTHLQTELSTAESECASLRKQNEILEKEVIRMRYERDVARGRVGMLRGKVGPVDGGRCKCGRKWERPEQELSDFEEGEEGFTVLRHVVRRTALPKSSSAKTPSDPDDGSGSEDMDLETDSDSGCGSK